jgi:hypothetical protein
MFSRGVSNAGGWSLTNDAEAEVDAGPGRHSMQSLGALLRSTVNPIDIVLPYLL